ncbi:MAG TPA: zinc ribbon domain-containing protein [Nitrospiraceae bacterium]|nr:zinc ribbon domain-containing protein [Nitrospiraceae bacterium]
MPLYEYRCLGCKKRSTILVLSLANQTPATCSHCASARVERILSRFASPKSEEARLEALADPSNLARLDEHDPRSMTRFMKKMGKEIGEDFGDDLSEAMESNETGALESDSTDGL